MFGFKTSQGDRMGLIGIQRMKVIKSDGTVRRQYQEFKPFAHLRKMYGIAMPRIVGVFGFMTDEVVFENLITNAGFAGAAARLGHDSTEAKFDYVAVGTGTTAAAVGNTTLETEITDSGLARAVGTVSRVTTTQTNDTHNVAKTFSVTGTKAITEMGLLNAAAAGVLLGRNVFSAINVVNTDTFIATYQVKCA